MAGVLDRLRADGLVQPRTAGPLSGWAPTSEARRLDAELLAGPLAPADGDGLRRAYPEFCLLDAGVKDLCTRWQLRPLGQGTLVPNDHNDGVYDRRLVEELDRLDRRAQRLLGVLAGSLGRVRHDQRRLTAALAALHEGDRDRFARPLCESYHDVWMELHHDLVVTLGTDRPAAGP